MWWSWKSQAVKVVEDHYKLWKGERINRLAVETYEDFENRIKHLSNENGDLKRRLRGTAHAVITLENRVEQFEKFMGCKYHQPDCEPYYVTEDPD